MLKTREGKEFYEANTTNEIRNWWFEDMKTGKEFVVRTIEEKKAFEIARAHYEMVKGFGSMCDAEAIRKNLPYIE